MPRPLTPLHPSTLNFSLAPPPFGILGAKDITVGTTVAIIVEEQEHVPLFASVSHNSGELRPRVLEKL
jgi:hypothetical protein